LFKGAREALESGAPHESELALASAIPSLPPESVPEAQLLLIEAIQEQGRYNESLLTLQALAAEPCTAGAEFWERVSVLQTAARVNSWSMPATELKESAQAMIRTVRLGIGSRTRLHAAQVAALALNELRDPEIAHALLSAVDLVPEEGYTHKERLALRLLKAQADLLGGITHVQTDDLLSLVRHAPSNVASSTNVRLMMTIGAVLARRGEYTEAVEYHKQAFRMAVRLGRDATAASTASNLAVCYLRIGNLPNQIEWAEACLRISGSHAIHLNGRMHAVYCRGLGVAMSSPARAVRDFLQRSEALIGPTAPPWMPELWHLFKADVLATAGAQAEAASTARGVFDYSQLKPAAGHYLGTYCRWCALAAQDRVAREQALTFLKGTAIRLEQYDALDQAEILLALALVGEESIANQSVQSLLQLRLTHLPEGVAHHFERVGMLRAYGNSHAGTRS
jgi:tetratricopeptide (TPR) repeat protein